ncbi:MAG: sigma-70 family RNA polymerase sigma factor [Planctomycetia bacterium]|jgi:RNA polymerase sigma-70 factor (ECF subfamily)|nr:sigma-70 family RNA polymerase sigma factor [Planctomycetia bacterium]
MLSPYAPLADRFVDSLSPAPIENPATEPDEAQLIAASRRGEAAAYGYLVRKYQRRLCSSLFHICGSSADAQDAAQEAFLQAFLKLNTYTGASAFYTWLYRIAVNALITEYRKRRTRLNTERSRSHSDEHISLKSECPDERLLRGERVEEVQRALANLSSEHRTILVLREIENCDYEEIASLLGIPVGTVRSRLHRARLELRAELNQVANRNKGRTPCAATTVSRVEVASSGI